MSELTFTDACSETFQQVQADNVDINWVVVGYADSSIDVIGSGTGGMAEAKEHLNDEVRFGAFRVVGVDERENVTSRRPKFVFFAYIPESVSVMKRAKAGRHKAEVRNRIFNSAHLDMHIDSAGDMTEDEIIAKLRACGGAHQPTSYEF